ncbi:MAG: hypothetical protein FWC20_02175 [Oscillospiraceae bacterium]|nr:hypothetical protein [Oscillospiraceae bacterium]MCL2278200.1 hypothetical protein [Oscillospiraceae bacterium]
MNFNLKVPHNKKLFKYVLVRLLFSSAIACLLLLGIYLFYGEMWIAIVLTIPLVIATCLYTAMIIARRTKDLVDVPLSKMLEFTHVLKDASLILIETAKNLDKKAAAMHTAADMLDEVAISCESLADSRGKTAKKE